MCICVGAVPHLRQEGGGCKEDKKITGVHPSRLQLALESRGDMMWHKQTRRMIRPDKAKLAILTSDCWASRKSAPGSYAVLARAGAHRRSGKRSELGTVHG